MAGELYTTCAMHTFSQDWVYQQLLTVSEPLHPTLPPLTQAFVTSILLPGTTGQATAYAVCGMWYVVCGMWYVVCGMWYVVCGMWYGVCGMGYVVCGMWYSFYWASSKN